MANSKTNRKRTPKHVLKLPDLEQSKSAVLIFLYHFILFLLHCGPTQGSEPRDSPRWQTWYPVNALESTVPRLCEFPIAKEKCDE